MKSAKASAMPISPKKRIEPNAQFFQKNRTPRLIGARFFFEKKLGVSLHFGGLTHNYFVHGY